MQGNENLLLARWDGDKNIDIREALSSLAKQEGDAKRRYLSG